MRSFLLLLAAVAIVYTMTQINALLGTGGPVVVSSIQDLVWAWRGWRVSGTRRPPDRVRPRLLAKRQGLARDPRVESFQGSTPFLFFNPKIFAIFKK